MKGLALEYAKSDWRVFPCQERAKPPAISSGFKAASCDISVVAEYWSGSRRNCNIGFATGDGLAVIDIDQKEDKNGFEWLAQHEELRDTLVARTAGGGLHLYFTAPPWLPCSASKVAAGVDVRAAGGYVLLPGSVVDGVAYAWERVQAIAPMPSWLIDACGRQRMHAGFGTVVWHDQKRDRMRQYLEVVPLDGRDRWVRVGMALHAEAGGGSDGLSIWFEWAERYRGPWSAHSASERWDYHVDRWRSFGGGGGRVTGAYISKLYKEHVDASRS